MPLLTNNHVHNIAKEPNIYDSFLFNCITSKVLLREIIICKSCEKSIKMLSMNKFVIRFPGSCTDILKQLAQQCWLNGRFFILFYSGHSHSFFMLSIFSFISEVSKSTFAHSIPFYASLGLGMFLLLQSQWDFFGLFQYIGIILHNFSYTNDRNWRLQRCDTKAVSILMNSTINFSKMQITNTLVSMSLFSLKVICWEHLLQSSIGIQ